jgi:biopolymer transport protein ExbD
MPNENRFDVWVARTKRIYRNVPFVSVADSVQQGRLHAEDRVRPAGAPLWQRVDDVTMLSAYLPRPVPFRAEDHAEALEPVELELSARNPASDDDDDPDMIPLIDVSLVLLVFFMMTAGSLITASPVETPPAENATVRATQAHETLTVSMAMVNGQVRYYLGDESESLEHQELLDRVAKQVRQEKTSEAVLRANPWIPYETVRQLIIELDQAGIQRIQAAVRDRRIEEDRP